MRYEVFYIKPPERYIANFIEYVPGLDSNPDLIDFLANGFSVREAEKMRFLLSIESAKYHFREAMEYGEITEDEAGEWQTLIENIIEIYNETAKVG